jgi:hypothetical protein
MPASRQHVILPPADGRDERVRVAEQDLVGADDHVDGRQACRGQNGRLVAEGGEPASGRPVRHLPLLALPERALVPEE